ncbi:MAG: DUF4245 domain-containing protein [Corynebacterium sp.]|uniref:DUF4245 domain-containing protein n=1 Tax=Corynebacterium sp. TaxID=1720 RepID=UPI0026DF55C5|nr:DUF4245 domain-containing protein [Corynebacterium sp.]MDO5668572.1 DUF4245 domain-containing protein [Corynebacterium sp.]
MSAAEKPRIFQDGRDMFLSLALIVVLMVVSVGATGLCTYEPGAPEGGPVREVDAHTFMGMEARATNFPVRMPENPEGWVTNSARRGQVNQTPAPIVGWVTDDRGFIQLTQTDQPLDDAVRGIDPDPRDLDRTVQVAGHEVQVYTSEESDVRDLWVVDMGDARLLFSGAGKDAEFEELIDATVNVTPLPAAGE